jgi:hypothetical protein
LTETLAFRTAMPRVLPGPLGQLRVNLIALIETTRCDKGV